jgi:O-antigen/teichoic acid export membrane protein
MNIAVRSQLIAVAFARTLYPELSRSHRSEALQIAEKSIEFLAYAFGAICGAAIVFANSFLTIWIGKDFAEVAGPILQMLLLGAWINGIAFIPGTLLRGQNRPDLIAKLHVAEAVPYLGILWLLLQIVGLRGAAIAWSSRLALDAAALFWLAQISHVCRIRLVAPILLMSGSFITAELSDASPATSIVEATGVMLIWIVFGLMFDHTCRRLVRNIAVRLFGCGFYRAEK